MYGVLLWNEHTQSINKFTPVYLLWRIWIELLSGNIRTYKKTFLVFLKVKCLTHNLENDISWKDWNS